MTTRADDLHIVAGTGSLFRSGPIVVFIPDPRTPAASAILSALAELPGANSDGTDERAWLAVGIIRQQALSLSSFAVAVQLKDRVLFLVRGAIQVMVKTPEGTIELDGTTALTWIDRVVPEPILRYGTGFDGLVFAGRLGRADGVVPAAGFLAYAEGVAANAAVQPDDVTARPTEVIRRPPPPPVKTPQVETGVYQQTARALVADDGTRVLLDRDYVFGRSPFRDPTVVQGTASPLVVQDPDHLVSRVQLHLTNRGGQVIVRDSGSANGTFIAAPGAIDWQQMNSDPVVLQPGWSIRLGRRVYTYVIE